MKGIDTNILVRFLTKDDVLQAEVAKRFILSCRENGIPCFINKVVLCELVWVLETVYRHSKQDIIHVLEGILSRESFAVEDSAAARSALYYYKKGPVDFADAMIAVTNRHLGCTSTVTFDKKAAQLEECTPLS